MVILGLSAGLNAETLTICKSPLFVDITTGDFASFITRTLEEHQATIDSVSTDVKSADKPSNADRVITLRLKDAHVSYNRLSQAKREIVHDLAGPNTNLAQWYESRMASFLQQVMAKASQDSPGVKLSVLGLPAEPANGNIAAAQATNARYAAVTASLDAFVSARKLILSGSTVNELSTVQAALPEAFRLAQGRAIVFRTNSHWRSVSTSAPIPLSGSLPETSDGSSQLPSELYELLESTEGEGPIYELLMDWGSANSPYDFVTASTFQPPGDGIVNAADLSYMLGNWSDFYPSNEEPSDEENPPADGGGDEPPPPPTPPAGQVGAFTTLGSQYVIGSGIDLPFAVDPNATNVNNVVFQVWSFVTHSIEAPAPDYTAPFTYPGSALANVTPGPGQVQAVVRTSTDALIAVIVQDVEFVSGSSEPPPPDDGGDDNPPPPPPPDDGGDDTPPDDGGGSTPPPDDPPADDPPGSLTGSPMGINLGDIQYYSPEWPFKNFFKMSMSWRDGSWNPSIPVALTSDGYPLLNPGQTAVSLMCRDIGGAYPTGPWVLLYDGSGTITVGGNAQLTSTSAGRLTFQVSNPTNEGIHVYISATDNNNPIRNIRAMPAEFESNYEAQPFHPLFLDRLQHFSVLRFMDWMKTNNSQQQNWSDRPTLTYATYGHKGAPIQIMVKLANETGASPWFCMPHLATDDYVQKFAEYVRDNLDPNIKAYVELSNECWNTMFQQTAYFQAQGQAQGLAGDPYLCTLRGYSKRAAQVMDIWTNVFQGQEDRIVRILAGHAENPWANEQIISYNNASQHADVLAVAPYFGGWLGNSSNTVNMTVQQILDAAEANIEVQKNHSINNKAKATQYGLDLIAYEGGQHLVGVGGNVANETLTQKFITANRSPEMGQLYLQDLANWKEIGGGVFCAYAFCGKYSQWGSWGLIEKQNQDLATAPKFTAVVDFVQECLQEQETQGGD